jgi:hypothetical protein
MPTRREDSGTKKRGIARTPKPKNKIAGKKGRKTEDAF